MDTQDFNYYLLKIINNKLLDFKEIDSDMRLVLIVLLLVNPQNIGKIFKKQRLMLFLN
jgi:hypothetical protein